MVIVIVNSLLKVVLSKLGSFARYKTVTAEVTGITTNLFIAVFINSALITLVLNADIYGFRPSKYISEDVLVFLKNEKAEYYPDFYREWYA